jgi:hypothetical protein
VRFKITVGILKRFVQAQLLIDDLENRFGILNVQTRTDPGFFVTVVYVTITKTDSKKILDWWSSTDKSGKYYKIELVSTQE